jgi:2-dehydropantoate 2-reductase
VHILVLGAGGIGGYFGGRLAEAGADVTFLVRPKRREQIARNGLVIESPLGNAKLDVRTVLAEELRPEYDAILLTCKAYDLEAAMQAIEPAMRDHEAPEAAHQCVIVPMLNGLAHLTHLDVRFGTPNVMGGTAQINVTMRKDGVIVHGDSLQRILFGERDRQKTARAQALADAFARSKVDWKLSDDIEQDLWEKIVFLCALATTTCLFRGNVREIVAASGGREAMLRAIEANAEIARREGHPPRPQMLRSARERLTDPEGLWSASMLRDLESGGQVEADHIVGWMLERARAHGIDDALLSLSYTHLKTYENRRAAARLPGS